jgi:hypothetical protein
LIEDLIITNKVTGYTLKFNMEDADYLLYEGGIDWGEVKVTHNTYNYSSMMGEYVTSSIIGTRDISIAGWIVGKTETDIFTKKETLSKVINPLQILRVKYGDYGIDAKASTNLTFSNTYKENNDKMCKFLIQLFCPFPLFTLNNDISVSLSEIEGNFIFPWVLTDETVLSYYKNTSFIEIVNNGMVDVGMKVVLKARGTVNNPTIISVSTQEQMKISKVLESGEEIVISTQDKRYVNGTLNGETTSYLDYFDYDNTWMQLQQGLNTLTVKTYDEKGNEDESRNNLNVVVYYNPSFYNLKEE